jgi:hypothetical protein
MADEHDACSAVPRHVPILLWKTTKAIHTLS